MFDFIMFIMKWFYCSLFYAEYTLLQTSLSLFLSADLPALNDITEKILTYYKLIIRKEKILDLT